MQHIEVVEFAELLDLREEWTDCLWVSSPCDIAVDWKDVRRRVGEEMDAHYSLL
jgi:hypothetical protein